MVVQELFSMRQQQAPSCQRNFLGTYCHFLNEIVYSQSHWIWSQTERPLNTVVTDWECRVALLQNEGRWNENANDVLVKCIKSRESTRLCRKRNILFRFKFLFRFRFWCAWLWLAEKFLQKRRWFLFSVVTTHFSCKAMCTITNKQHNCRFLVLRMSIHNVAAGFEPFTVVETIRFIDWNVNTLFISTCWAKHISNDLLYFVVHTQFFLSIFVWFKWDVKY